MVAIAPGIGCGRLAFDTPDAGGPGAADASSDSADGSAPIARVTTFVMRQVRSATPTLTTDAFTSHAMLAGDAILVHAFCEASVAPSSVTVSAPGWSFVRLDPISGSIPRSAWGTSFAAIAPDTADATVSVTWTFGGGGGCTFVDEMGDEFTNNDTAGSEITFESHVAQFGSGNSCIASVLTKHDGDAVWAACTPSERVVEPVSGYTVGARDGLGDISAFKLTSDPAGTVESIAMTTSTSDGYVITMVAIKPR